MHFYDFWIPEINTNIFKVTGLECMMVNLDTFELQLKFKDNYLGLLFIVHLLYYRDAFGTAWVLFTIYGDNKGP